MKDYNEEEFLMLSGIQHYSFCIRQWALIHIEQQWKENIRTVEGNIFHNRAHEGPSLEHRGKLIISRGMPVFSCTLGVNGVCDIVEFHREVKENRFTVQLQDEPGFYRIMPVEYKKGEPKVSDFDRLQLTAQAMCLEDMFGTIINKGVLYYGATRHRETVEITDRLRNVVITNCKNMHVLFEKGHTPKVKPTKACNACSLKELCIPKLNTNRSAKKYIMETVKGTTQK